MPRHYRIDGGGRLIRHMRDVHFGSNFEALDRQVSGGADARGGIAEFLALGQLDQFFQIFGRRRRIDWVIPPFLTKAQSRRLMIAV